MFKKIDIKDFKATEGVIAFDGTVFADAFSRNQSDNTKLLERNLHKNTEYSLRSVHAISRGKIPGIITDLEMGKVRRVIGFENARKLFERDFQGPNCMFYEIGMAGYLDEYSAIPAYCKLFNLCRATNLHIPNLTSVIASIEIDKPLVTNDYHHWQQQSNIRRAYRERHADKRAEAMIERRITGNIRMHPSDMKMYNSKDFCDLILKGFDGSKN